jgi:uncharacterized phage protein (TIGR01671 family)
MNREIKFRAWESQLSKMHQWKDAKQWNFYWLESFTFVFMQYTGLEDKNGKEIYEGDVIHDTTTDSTIFVIECWNGCFQAVDKDDIELQVESEKYVEYLWDVHQACEIIGNIYENPELLT